MIEFYQGSINLDVLTWSAHGVNVLQSGIPKKESSDQAMSLATGGIQD
jgi:hypothetical protein